MLIIENQYKIIEYRYLFDEHGKVCYPYKLERGRADQNIVFNVLNEKGFVRDFVARSVEMLAALKERIN